MVDAHASGACEETHGGSSPFIGNLKKEGLILGLFTPVVPKEQRWFTRSSILPRKAHSSPTVQAESLHRQFISLSLGEGRGEGDYKPEFNYIFCFPHKNNMNKYNLLARYLRKSQTPQEQKLWNLLRNRQLLGYKFKRQYPIGNYIVDFVCREKKLVIELDGGQHNITVNINYDFLRSEYINQRGFKVIRFWNKEIDENIEGVIAKITEELNN